MRRSELSKKIFVPIITSVLIVCVIFVLSFFYAPRYILIEAGTLFFLACIVSFYAGVLQMHAAKKMGKPVSWWKQASIIMALYQGCLGICAYFVWLYIYLGFAHDEINDLSGIIIVTLVILLAASLIIYGNILAFSHLKATRKALAEIQAQHKD